MNTLFSELIEKDRWIRIAYNRVRSSDQFDFEISNIVETFLNDYITANSISILDVVKMYNKFTSLYSRHIREFLSTGKYPLELGKVAKFTRAEYDVVLILSIVLSLHRHLIFKKLKSVISQLNGNTLLVGIGSGIEITFFDLFNINVDAYDISIASFVKKKFSRHSLIEEYFTGDNGKYSNIFAIELMEHLPDPLEFSEICYRSLKPGGHFYFTTATNIPQADHTINFNDLDLFELDLKKIGFSVSENLLIKHEAMDEKLHATNNWYGLKKQE